MVSASGSGRRACGLITEGDLRRALLKGAAFFSLTAKDIMMPNPVCIAQDALAFDALAIMENRKSPISVLVVVENNKTNLKESGGRVVSLIRLHDLVGRL